MIPYFLGGCVGYIAVLILAGVMHWAEAHQVLDQPWLQVALLLVVLPASIQALAGDATARVLRKRLFHPRARAGYTLLFLGVGVSIVVVGVTALALPFFGSRFGEVVVISSVAALVSAVAVAVLRRTKPGRCVACGYSLQHAGAASRCPECGEATLRAVGLSSSPHGRAEQTRPPHVAHSQGRVS